MSARHNLARLSLTALVVIASGCAPRQLCDGVAWEIQRSKTSNAAWQFVRHRPYLRVNAYLMDRLHHVETLQDLEAARNSLSHIVEEAFVQARHAFNNEIDRLPQSSLQFLAEHYTITPSTKTQLREDIRNRFWQGAQEHYQRIQASIAEALSLNVVHAMARRLDRAVLPSPKDRRGGGLLLAMVAASIKEERGALDHGGKAVDVYELDPKASVDFSGLASKSETDLLRRYAPVIVQERIRNAPYPPNTDLIGTVRLQGNPSDPTVEIDTSKPSVYAYVQRTLINGRDHIQLTYTHWFPRHVTPLHSDAANCALCEGIKVKSFDAEAGRIEGVTVRITLDRDQRPAIFETILNCGCYHRCYVSRSVESASCSEYGEPIEGKSFCVEQTVKGKMDWIVGEIVDDSGSFDHPLLFSRAGYHRLTGVSFDKKELEGLNVLNHRDYTLRPYEALERLSIGGVYRSMFGVDGLVRNAGRMEGFLLALTGMRSAGQPRQRGTQLLHWDQYDFDDPHLLEKCLRLPSGL